MDRVHISTVSIKFFPPLIPGKRENIETIKFYFSSSDGITQTMSRHDASQSASMKNPRNPRVS